MEQVECISCFSKTVLFDKERSQDYRQHIRCIDCSVIQSVIDSSTISNLEADLVKTRSIFAKKDEEINIAKQYVCDLENINTKLQQSQLDDTRRYQEVVKEIAWLKHCIKENKATDLLQLLST
jgi:hypothetical protein